MGAKKTKHVELKYHFVREYVDKGTLAVEFVRTENNKADPFTKNVGGVKFSTDIMTTSVPVHPR